MISKESIDRIFDAVRIEEVIGDFVQLKRSGSSLKGLSPFNPERTPSFFVSPAKGIFKDFSSGKGGNAVTFLMELENMSYPEALQYLAAKYGVEIEQTEATPEQKAEETLRESLSLVNKFAADYFENTLWNTDEGKNVGLSYFREREFTDITIRKFGLGYAPDQFNALLNSADEAGYNTAHLITLGLVKEGEHGKYDFFKGRVIFPIRNATGKTIAFAGRTLKSDNKVKYLNSPESELYDKSKTLYGLFEAKKGITSNDLCFLVEGYTDVISLHQAGVDYAVASAGTSLTPEQVKLIRRYTNNIAILYDGDKAGINAALRAIDLLLAEDMRVKVILFPDGHDPDSFARTTPQEELFSYLKSAALDFTDFMADVLLKDAGNDPIQVAQTSRRIVESISLIKDNIARSVYVSSAARKLGIKEEVLLLELNRLIRKNSLRKAGIQTDEVADLPAVSQPQQQALPAPDPLRLEREVTRVLVLYGNQNALVSVTDEEGNEKEIEVPVAEIILHELISEEIEFRSPEYSMVINYVKSYFEEYGTFPGENILLKSPDQKFIETITGLISKEYELSENWSAKHRIFTETEEQNLKRTALDPLMRLKLIRILEMIELLENTLSDIQSEPELDSLLREIMRLNQLKSKVSEFYGSAII